jgi:streptogramin lyase
MHTPCLQTRDEAMEWLESARDAANNDRRPVDAAIFQWARDGVEYERQHKDAGSLLDAAADTVEAMNLPCCTGPSGLTYTKDIRNWLADFDVIDQINEAVDKFGVPDDTSNLIDGLVWFVFEIRAHDVAAAIRAVANKAIPPDADDEDEYAD